MRVKRAKEKLKKCINFIEHNFYVAAHTHTHTRQTHDDDESHERFKSTSIKNGRIIHVAMILCFHSERSEKVRMMEKTLHAVQHNQPFTAVPYCQSDIESASVGRCDTQNVYPMGSLCLALTD